MIAGVLAETAGGERRVALVVVLREERVVALRVLREGRVTG
ncbi:hypothetical protein [Nocardia arizonensis]|nr:hypothetical protein [Nocardia arizonensis]